MRKCFLIIQCIVFASCSSSAIDDLPYEDTPVKTDQTKYTAVSEDNSRFYDFTVITEFTNVTNDTLYLQRCTPDYSYPIHGIEAINTDKVSAYSRVWACVGHNDHPVLKPNEMRIDTLHFLGPTMISQDGEAEGVFEGRHRISISAYSCADRTYSCRVVDSVNTSNMFIVEIGS